MKGRAPGAQMSKFKSQLCQLIAAGPSADDFPLPASFLICKMGFMVVPVSPDCGNDYGSQYGGRA